jgi:starch-binding outer membrane protein, SusD/RagB family
MKNLKYYLILAIVAIINTSCSEFLDEVPRDLLVVENFYQTTSDAQAAVNAAYSTLIPLYNRPGYLVGELSTDAMKDGQGMFNAMLQDMVYLRVNSQNTFVQTKWQNYFFGVSRANSAINNIPSISMNQRLQNRLIAEARFLRALYYFDLVRLFGDVPLITNLRSLSDALIPRTPKAEVYNQIIDDLTFAEEHLWLKSEYSAADQGRPTIGAAKILLGKVYLTMQNFTAARDKLAEVVNNEATHGYGLHPNFRDNWIPATERGVEAVFYIEFLGPPTGFNGRMQGAGPRYSVPNLGTTVCFEADLPTLKLVNSYSPGDQRLEATIKYTFPAAQGSTSTSTIPLFGKYWENGFTAATANRCQINYHYLRYADALLMYAEALNETDQTGNALPILNRVRERAFGNTSGNYGTLTKDEFRNAVLNERYLELAFEGQRWFDLVRTGTFVSKMTEYSAYEVGQGDANKAVIAENVESYMMLYPIPQRERDLNPQLEQNPGYN